MAMAMACCGTGPMTAGRSCTHSRNGIQTAQQPLSLAGFQPQPLASPGRECTTGSAGISSLRASRCKPQAARRRHTCRAFVSASTNGRGPVVVVDNYDSFTYNLSQYLGDLGCDHVVLKNDEKTIAEIRAMDPAGILVSPGPGRPEDSGISLGIIEEMGRDTPLMGVCMGHQCIGQVFGGRIVRAPCGVMHGKQSLVFHENVGLLQGLANPFAAARYHSLVIAEEAFPHEELEVTARTEDGTIMGVRHRKYPHIQGVQFHPESIITDNGLTIVRNFVEML